MSILVTGFEAFGGHVTNPSGLIVEQLRGRPDLVAAVLPTSYERGGGAVERLLAQYTPSAVLLLGLSARASGVVLERRARNWDDSPAVDNDGVQRSGVPIAADGPASYPSTLPLERLAMQVRSAGLPSDLSDDAGGFVCNHVFYRAAHYIVRSNLHVLHGFVHVPLANSAERQKSLQDCIERFIEVLNEPVTTQ